MDNSLTNDFLYELFKLCFRKKEVTDICVNHLKFSYLPTESFKKFWKAFVNYYKLNNQIPTIGTLSQQFAKDKEVISIMAEIKESNMPDRDATLKTFENFIKQGMFIEAYDKLADEYNNNSKQSAYKMFKEYADSIDTFSILKGTKIYEEIFGGFEKRTQERRLKKLSGESVKTKIPLGIDEIDAILKGGMSEKEIALFLAQSGVGKTKLLRWIGISAVRRGYKVLHLQAEGSSEECYRGYDSTWSGLTNEVIDNADLDENLYDNLKKLVKNIKIAGGEIYVYTYEQFTKPKLTEVVLLIQEIEKLFGKIDLILLDYFELFDPATGFKYKIEQERERRRDLGRNLKNIAIEFSTRVISCTQASDVPPNLREDPDFVMTRSNVSEFKNIAEPFDMFVTLNQTRDEKRNNVMRLYIDKLRNYPCGQVVKIFQSYKNDRFYDRKKTLEEFYFPEED